MAIGDFIREIGSRVVVGDGAMGTSIYAKGVPLGHCYDDLNRSRPHLIRKVHEEMLDAGAELIETNTFTANRLRLKRFGLEAHVAEINQRGVAVAREAAGTRAWVAGSVGPLAGVKSDDPISAAEKADVFAEQIRALDGVDMLILETFVDLNELLLALRVARAESKKPVIAQMTFTSELRTPLGDSITDAVAALEKAGADVIGVNCGVGPFYSLKVVEAAGRLTRKPISAFSNAGAPEFVDGRYMYLTTPEYFAQTAHEMVKAGANLVGGCCGTTYEHIQATAARIGGSRLAPRTLRPAAQVLPAEAAAEAPARRGPSWFESFGRRKVNVVEIDPPRGMGHEKLIERCVRLHKAGFDAITVGDNPLAVMRMGNIGFAHLLEQQGVPTIVHLSCRDKNLIALQSTILEAAALGVQSILAITGDPAKVGDQPGASSVYDLNSFELIRLIAQMNEGVNFAGVSIKRKTRFVIGGAFGPNVDDIEPQIRRLKKKVDAGMHFALPQPLYDIRKVRPMYARIREAVGDVPTLFGICPFVSAKNAEFLAHEVPGIRVPEEVLERMRNAPEDRQRAEGMKITKELIDEAWDVAPGFYLVPPFASEELSLECLEYVRSKSRSARATR